MHKFLIISILILLSSKTSSFAATKNWTGSISTDWSATSNWKPASLPISSDDIVIPIVKSGNYPILSAGSYNIKSLKIQPEGTLVIIGGTLNIAGKVTIQKDGPLIQNNGLVTTDDILIIILLLK